MNKLNLLALIATFSFLSLQAMEQDPSENKEIFFLQQDESFMQGEGKNADLDICAEFDEEQLKKKNPANDDDILAMGIEGMALFPSKKNLVTRFQKATQINDENEQKEELQRLYLDAAAQSIKIQRDAKKRLNKLNKSNNTIVSPLPFPTVNGRSQALIQKRNRLRAGLDAAGL